MSSTSPSSGGTAARIGAAGAAALLLFPEAAWMSLAVAAFVNGTSSADRPRLDLPYLAFVLPALVSLLVVTAVRGGPHARRTRARRWTRHAAVVVVVVAGMALCAGIVGGLSASGTTWTIAFHPWSLPAHALVAQRAARWAWAVAVLAWGRGAWVAIAPPSLPHAATSLVIGAIVFVVVFGHQAASGPGRFDRATSAAGWLLFVYFPLGITSAAWIQERAVERRVLRRAGPVPSGAWFAVLLVPLALVALVAFIVGGAATFVGPAAVRVAHALGALIGAVGDWFFHVLPRITLHPGHRTTTTTLPRSPFASHHRDLASTHPTALGIAVLCVVGAIVLAAVVLGARALVRLVRRRRSVQVVDEERESVFTWAHFGEQLRRSLRALVTRLARLFRRRRRRAMQEAATTAATPWEKEPGGDAVRLAYRRVLVAANTAALGRGRSETPSELAARLTADPVLERRGAAELHSLTELYESVRYADADSGPVAARAATDAETVVVALAEVRDAALQTPVAPES